MPKRRKTCSLRKAIMQHVIVYSSWKSGEDSPTVQLLRSWDPQELKRDIGTRLFKFRGDMDIEMKSLSSKRKDDYRILC